MSQFCLIHKKLLILFVTLFISSRAFSQKPISVHACNCHTSFSFGKIDSLTALINTASLQERKTISSDPDAFIKFEDHYFVDSTNTLLKVVETEGNQLQLQRSYYFYQNTLIKLEKLILDNGRIIDSLELYYGLASKKQKLKKKQKEIFSFYIQKAKAHQEAFQGYY